MRPFIRRFGTMMAIIGACLTAGLIVFAASPNQPKGVAPGLGLGVSVINGESVGEVVAGGPRLVVEKLEPDGLCGVLSLRVDGFEGDGSGLRFHLPSTAVVREVRVNGFGRDLMDPADAPCPSVRPQAGEGAIISYVEGPLEGVGLRQDSDRFGRTIDVPSTALSDVTTVAFDVEVYYYDEGARALDTSGDTWSFGLSVGAAASLPDPEDPGNIENHMSGSRPASIDFDPAEGRVGKLSVPAQTSVGRWEGSSGSTSLQVQGEIEPTGSQKLQHAISTSLEYLAAGLVGAAVTLLPRAMREAFPTGGTKAATPERGASRRTPHAAPPEPKRQPNKVPVEPSQRSVRRRKR